MAKSLALLLGLLGVSMAFVIVQRRFDARDPKLSIAPLEADVARFA